MFVEAFQQEFHILLAIIFLLESELNVHIIITVYIIANLEILSIDLQKYLNRAKDRRKDVGD